MDNVDLRLDGRTVLVTGGGRGLGRGIALGMANVGADIAICDIDMEAAKSVADEVRALGRRSMAVQADVASVEAVQSMVEAVAAEFGRIDVLVNNAGINRRAPAIDVTEEQWDQVMSVNLKGVFFVAQAVGRVMIKQGGGKIINMASAAGKLARSQPPVTVYGIAKAGVIHMTRYLAVEWAQHNVHVNAIAPGYTVTDLTRTTLSNPEVADKLISYYPLGRFGEIEDLVGPAILLASSASNYITGHTLFVDGGRSAI